MSTIIRPLRWRDAAYCWRVAAEPTVRAMSFDPSPPTLRKHLRWMWRNLYGKDDRAWVVVVDPDGFYMRAGVTTLRRREFCWYIGMAIEPWARGKGVGTAAVRLTTVEAPKNHAVFAAIKQGNIDSLRLFHSAGYGNDIQRRDGSWLLYHPAR